VPATPTYRKPEEIYLLHNKIYSAGQVPAVACTLPDIAVRSQKAVQQYASAVLDCLQRAWKPLVVRAHVKFVPAVTYAVNQGSKTACGIFGKEDYGYYCRANSGIYLDWDQLVEDEGTGPVAAQATVQVLMAHEFGHHVQRLVRISQYYDDRWDRTTGATRLEQMRRQELQASCFASAFLGANQAPLNLYDDRLRAYRWAAHSGDDGQSDGVRDHGSDASNAAWADEAFSARSPAACNTWAAPAEWVS
jgi:predicted metalloprotease